MLLHERDRPPVVLWYCVLSEESEAERLIEISRSEDVPEEEERGSVEVETKIMFISVWSGENDIPSGDWENLRCL